MLDSIINYLAENPRVLLGNIFGLIATVFSFIAFQMKTPKKLLFMNSCVLVSIIISYAILEAWSGAALNALCLFRNYSYTKLDKKPFSYKWWPYVLAVVLGGIGALSWQGPITLFVMFALMINTIFMSLNDNQKLRASTLVSSPMIIVYDALNQAYIPILLESMVVISSTIGLIRFRKKR